MPKESQSALSQGIRDLDRTVAANRQKLERYHDALEALDDARTEFREHRASHWQTTQLYLDSYVAPQEEQDQLDFFVSILTARRIQRECRRAVQEGLPSISFSRWKQKFQSLMRITAFNLKRARVPAKVDHDFSSS
jgi:hypothetical protein